MGYKGITLLQIDYFFAVAKYLNFTEAAKSLYVTQPALSKQIAALEHEIGVQLFMRTKRDVRLTPAGAVLMKELEGVLGHIEHAVEKAKSPDLGENETLRIGCLDAVDTNPFLPKLIKTFKGSHPNVTIELERLGFKSLREKLINGTLDLIFTLSFEMENTQGILTNTVYQHNSSLIMDLSNPLAEQPNLKLSDFKDQNFVMISRDESPNGFDGIIKLCRAHGFTPKISKQYINIESVLLSVEMGSGVAMVDKNIRMYHSENFKFIDIENDFISVVMAWRKENIKPVVSLFTNHILEKTQSSIE